MSSVLKATIENKNSVTTHYTVHMLINEQGTTCLLSQLLSKVTVASCRSSAGILHRCLHSAAGLRAITHSQEHADLRRENVTFIEHFMWPQTARTYSRLHCLGCPSTELIVCQHRRFTTINQQEQAIVTEWGKLLQSFIDCAIGQWSRRLECIVSQQSKKIEHLM